jgi:hypothetical protein
MRKVLRGYATDQNGNLILIGTIPVLLARTSPLQENARTNDLWSGRGKDLQEGNNLLVADNRAWRCCERMHCRHPCAKKSPASRGAGRASFGGGGAYCVSSCDGNG